MNPVVILTIVQIGLSLMFAAAAYANYTVLQSINLKISDLNSALREWARSLFAERVAVDALDRRVHELELLLIRTRAGN